MKVGSLVYATDQGLGILAKAFYDHGVVTDALVVLHDSRPNHPEWYPGCPCIRVKPFDVRRAQQFLRGLDAVLFFETPFAWNLLNWCRQQGVLTVLMPMYECTPAELPAQPDWFFCPSLLDRKYYPERSTYLPVPVEVPWRPRWRAEVFVHNAGNLGLRGRNGTLELFKAMALVRSPLKLLVRGQTQSLAKIAAKTGVRDDPRVEIRAGNAPYHTLWHEGDVLVHPEKFNGLSLPLQEARAAGMVVMSTDRFPANAWLPRDPLIPVRRYAKNRIGGCNEFDEALVAPEDIAATMDAWHGRDISSYSLSGREWAEVNSWEALGPQYRAEFERLLADKERNDADSVRGEA